MNKGILLALLGAGGFALYEWYSSQQPVTSTTAPPTTGSVAPPGTTTTTPPATVTPPATPPLNVGKAILAANASGVLTPDTLVKAAGGSVTNPNATVLNVSQWNWYMTQLTGIPGQALGDDGTPMRVGSYIALLIPWANANGGLSGLGCIYPRSMRLGVGFEDLQNEDFMAALGSGLGLLF